MVEVVGVEAVEFDLDGVEAFVETFEFDGIFLGSHLVGEIFGLVLQLVEIGQPQAGLLDESRSGFEIGVLFEEGVAAVGMPFHAAGVGLVEAGQDPQERRFSNAIGADDPDFLPGPNVEGDVLEDGLEIELAGEILDSEKNHETKGGNEPHETAGKAKFDAIVVEESGAEQDSREEEVTGTGGGL